MKIYCSTRKISDADFISKVLGKDIWIEVYQNTPYGGPWYYMKFISEVNTSMGVLYRVNKMEIPDIYSGFYASTDYLYYMNNEYLVALDRIEVEKNPDDVFTTEELIELIKSKE